MAEWRAQLIGSSQIEPNLNDLEVTDSINRFAKAATLTVEDTDGTAASRYPRGERVELEYSTDNGSNWNRWIAVTPQDLREKSARGDILEVECVGYDFFLRREDVYDTFTSGTAFSTVLQDVIENFTPVTWNAANVTLVNDDTLSSDLEFKSAKPDQIIDEISIASGNEEYGVNDDFEFFFRPRETENAPSDILDGDWFDYEFPTEGKRSVNKVRLFYNEGSNRKSVVVEDRAAQRDLKNRLNSAQNVVLGTSATYPYITTEENAQRKANQILTNRSVIQTGEVTSFGRYGISPGDVFRLQIPDKEIDSDFRAAEITHRWRADEVDLTVAEQTDGTSDELLASLSDDVSRVDARDADPDGDTTQFLELTDGITVDASATVTRTALTGGRFTPGLTRDQPGLSRDELGFESGGTTNPEIQSIVITREGLNRFRDAWQGESPDTINELAFGTGTNSATIGDSALETQIATTSGTASASGSFEIALTGTLSSGGAAGGSNLTEFGFFDSSGTLLVRATFDPSLHSSNVEHSVSCTLTIDDDPQNLGVITETGQTEVRNQWVDGAGDIPTTTAYGTGTADAAETDTALGNKIIEKTVSTTDGTTGTSNVVTRLTTADANGNDISELGEENSVDDLLSRIVIEPISKTSAFEIETNHLFVARSV